MDADERLEIVITKTAVLESRLDGHEDICSKRYGEIATAFATLQTQLTDINQNLRNALIAAVVFLIGILGTVFYEGLPWDKHEAEQVRE